MFLLVAGAILAEAAGALGVHALRLGHLRAGALVLGLLRGVIADEGALDVLDHLHRLLVGGAADGGVLHLCSSG